MTPQRSAVLSLFTLVLFFGALLPTVIPKPVEAQITIQDTPTSFIASGVTSYDIAETKLFWHTGVSICPPSLVAGDDLVQPAALESEMLKRIAVTGGEIRDLYSKERACSQNEIFSDIVADTNYLYWIGLNGLMRLSTSANVGDQPQLFSAALKGYSQIALSNDAIYGLQRNQSAGSTTIRKIAKADAANSLFVTHNVLGSDLKVQGNFVYYRLDNGTLRRIDANKVSKDIATGIKAYYPEGLRLPLCLVGQPCTGTNYVFYSKGNKIFRYNNSNESTSAALYTSSNAQATILEIVTSYLYVSFIEEHTQPCSGDPCFISSTNYVNRINYAGGGFATLYNTQSAFWTQVRSLKNTATHLFWQENGGLKRLPINASALPNINMKVTGIEVTQGIQSIDNSVLLIKGKRTFVRVHVKSDGAAVNNVTLRLSSPSKAQVLLPVNSIGTKLTVRSAPDRNQIDHSFLFELPWSWINQNNLSLEANLNPFLNQLEPNYADNKLSKSVTFVNSPKLSVEFFRLNYAKNGTYYQPRYVEDVLMTYSWMQRVYPIGGPIGENFKPRLWKVEGDKWLADLVDRSHKDCAELYPDATKRNLCASKVTNGWLKYYRDKTKSGDLNVGLKTDAFYYGMISDGLAFPRGQANYSKTSVGPTGDPSSRFAWDTDDSYADWYAGHEIGHSLGRAHPRAGSGGCGHSNSDANYPYGSTSGSRAPIGPDDGSVQGFDVGAPAHSIPRRVLPSASWNDLMSYCNNQWISDYTYKAMYTNMLANPSLLADVDISVVGDLLSLSGVIDEASDSAGFAFVVRLGEASSLPPLVAGPYAIRLLDGSNAQLASYAFTPEASHIDEQLLDFDQIVTFKPGTRTIQIVRLSDNKVLGTYSVSANAPVVSNVALEGAPNPVSGVVTLKWQASDADGDELSFTIEYSRDGGSNFTPVKLGVTGTSTTIDTAALAGSPSARFRVVASDGVNVGSADSANFVMANKAPEVVILQPGDNSKVHYGQLVNFDAMALDLQDGTVDPTNFVWKLGPTVLGNGAQISVDSLPVGSNLVTVEATNSLGQKGSATVTVIVDDDMDDPGVVIAATPDQVAWNVAVGATAEQSAVISISNLGSGSMKWTASSDQTWLTVSETSGTVNNGDAKSLTLKASPSGLAADTSHVAHLTLTVPATDDAPAQSIKVLVVLTIGDVRQGNSNGGGSFTIFLPTVMNP
jgi:hypothetical protein